MYLGAQQPWHKEVQETQCGENWVDSQHKPGMLSLGGRGGESHSPDKGDRCQAGQAGGGHATATGWPGCCFISYQLRICVTFIRCLSR